jgi:pantoate--beta-alanine ligase
MGSLHAGHLSLVAAAASECDLVAVSIFVNPIQFTSSEDLAGYPHDLEGDLGLARAAGAGIVFAPSVAEMYPDGKPETRVEPGPIAQRLEGASRPGHFAGVATVVTKLLSLCGPCQVYFGEKDYQQFVVVRRIVSELDLDAGVVACPTVREADGLAYSSRNRRLGPDDRQAAGVLFKALVAGRDRIADGAVERAEVERTMAAVVASEPRAELDYARVVDDLTLEPVVGLAGELRLLIAAQVGPVRLIDNMAVQASRPPSASMPGTASAAS